MCRVEPAYFGETQTLNPMESKTERIRSLAKMQPKSVNLGLLTLPCVTSPARRRTQLEAAILNPAVCVSPLRIPLVLASLQNGFGAVGIQRSGMGAT